MRRQQGRRFSRTLLDPFHSFSIFPAPELAVLRKNKAFKVHLQVPSPLLSPISDDTTNKKRVYSDSLFPRPIPPDTRIPIYPHITRGGEASVSNTCFQTPMAPRSAKNKQSSSSSDRNAQSFSISFFVFRKRMSGCSKMAYTKRAQHGESPVSSQGEKTTSRQVGGNSSECGYCINTNQRKICPARSTTILPGERWWRGP